MFLQTRGFGTVPGLPGNNIKRKGLQTGRTQSTEMKKRRTLIQRGEGPRNSLTMRSRM
jgi:hypothetical protein